MKRHAQRGFQPSELPPETQAKIDAAYALLRGEQTEDSETEEN